MLRLLSDEDFHGAIVRGVRRRCAECDIVRVQDVDVVEVAEEEELGARDVA